MTEALRRSDSDRAFTLVELLVVVAVIAILAAIAVPNFLEAQTRSKVSAAKANLRTGETVLQAYAVDNARWPGTRSVFPEDPLGVLAHVQLRVLSTPVAYLTSTSVLHDPFGDIRVRVRTPGQPGAKQGGGVFPELQPPNDRKSLLYFHYPTIASRQSLASLDRFACSLLSIGPDQVDSAGAYVIASPADFAGRFAAWGLAHPADTVYDPTNGSVSEGDITRVVGTAQPYGP